MKIQVSARSIFEVGQRSNQEDFLYPALSDQPLTGDLFILCDGMGGHENGEVASQTVCHTMSSYIEQHRREDGLFEEADFRNALSAAYDALDAKDTAAEKKMGTTLTFVKFHKGGCFIAHIGDSRIYHIRPATKEILYKTRDHSLVNDLISLGEMTPEEARTSTQKNIITRAMQPHQERRAQADCINLTDLQVGDYFYMCSDGMLEISEDSEIVNILSMNRSDVDKIEILKGATRENRDNHSAHLIRIVSVDVPSEKVVTPPVASPTTPVPEPPVVSPEAPPATAPSARPAAAPSVPPKVSSAPRPAPARRSSSMGRIIPILLGLVFLAVISYGMVCMLKKAKSKPQEPERTNISTEIVTEDSPQQFNHPTNRQNNLIQTTPQTHTQTQTQAQTQNPVSTHVEVQDRPAPVEPQSIEIAPLPNDAPTEPEVVSDAEVEAEYGKLTVLSDPPAALVFIDGADTGKKTPATFMDLSVNVHSVELRKEGYVIEKQDVDISKKGIVNITLKQITDGKDNE